MPEEARFVSRNRVEVEDGMTLYSPAQIALAALIGSPVAACWFLARNYRQLGHPGSATQWLVWGTAGTAALAVTAFLLPEGFPSQGTPIGYAVGLFELARQIQGRTVTERVSAGARLVSWGTVAGISLVCLGVILGAVLGVTVILSR
jgi:hypothetical protein